MITKNNPYFVEWSLKTSKTIEFAIERGLLSVCDDIEKNLINEFTDKKALLPIYILENASVINSGYNNIPITYQKIWLCLHGSFVTRVQPSGIKFRTKVNLTSCYIKSDGKIKSLLNGVYEKLLMSRKNFSSLCGYKERTIQKSKDNIPLIVILKACELLKEDPWKFLENYELYGKTNKKGKTTIPLRRQDNEINKILIWLRTEGHIELKSTHIEINQKDSIKSIEQLRQLIARKFKLNETSLIIRKGVRGEDRLIITSSPLRQVLCLKYGFPLGYKTGSLNRMNFEGLRKKDYPVLMAAFMETEGCLSHHYSRGKKKKLPRFEFIVKDKALGEDCLNVLRTLGFSPTFSENQNSFKVGLYKSMQVIDLINKTKDYLLDTRKVERLKKVCTYGNQL